MLAKIQTGLRVAFIVIAVLWGVCAVTAAMHIPTGLIAG